jgi:hypothetical protein
MHVHFMLYLRSVDKPQVINTFPDERETFPRKIDFYLRFSLQKMTWAWAAVSHHRTFKHHRLNLHTASTHKPPISWHRTCWVKPMRRTTATSAPSITITTTLTITRDFLTRTRNTKCPHRLQPTSIPTTKGSTDMEWSDKSNTSPDKFHGELTVKIFLVVRNVRWKSLSQFL